MNWNEDKRLDEVLRREWEVLSAEIAEDNPQGTGKSVPGLRSHAPPHAEPYPKRNPNHAADPVCVVLVRQF